MGSGRGKRLNSRILRNQLDSGVLNDPDTLKRLSRLTPPLSYSVSEESDEPTREKRKKANKVADDGEPIRLALVKI